MGHAVCDKGHFNLCNFCDPPDKGQIAELKQESRRLQEQVDAFRKAVDEANDAAVFAQNLGINRLAQIETLSDNLRQCAHERNRLRRALEEIADQDRHTLWCRTCDRWVASIRRSFCSARGRTAQAHCSVCNKQLFLHHVRSRYEEIAREALAADRSEKGD